MKSQLVSHTPEISLEQFHQEVQDHRDRVFSGALQALGQFGQEFPALMSLPEEARNRVFKTYMRLHDAPKIMSERELRGWGYKDKKTILEKLHGVYGLSLTRRPWFINDMNTIEIQIKTATLDNKFQFLYGSLKRQAKKELQFIEWVSDITDTLFHRGAELGMNFSAESAQKYFLNQSHTQAARIATWLGANRGVRKDALALMG
jgi:hypothetical protein